MTRRIALWSAALVLALTLTWILGGALVAQGAPHRQQDILPPQVYDTSPLPGEELALNGTVTFYFNQPMDQQTVEASLAVQPGVAYAITWADDSTMVFTPQADYQRASEYTFTIGTEAMSAAGVAMEEPFTLKLQTIGYLDVSEVLPAPDSEAVDTDAVITVIFNRPVVPLSDRRGDGDAAATAGL